MNQKQFRGAAWIGLAVGNTRTRVGILNDRSVEDVSAFANQDTGAIITALEALAQKTDAGQIALASVNPSLAHELARQISSHFGPAPELLLVGRDIHIPLNHRLDNASTLGQDRALNAVGAFALAKGACVIVDAGTAVTVDFVDGEGTFGGGVIAPGATMMLRALHAQTAQLPEVAWHPPDPARGVFGLDTAHAMLLGVRGAIVGLVRHQLERYAEAYGGYPKVIATGGDAAALFDGDEIVEHVVPDLQLLGLAHVCRGALESDAGLEEDDADA